MKKSILGVLLAIVFACTVCGNDKPVKNVLTKEQQETVKMLLAQKKIAVESQTEYPELAEKASVYKEAMIELQNGINSIEEQLHKNRDEYKTAEKEMKDAYSGWKYVCKCHNSEVYDMSEINKRDKKCRIQYISKYSEDEKKKRLEAINDKRKPLTRELAELRKEFNLKNTEYSKLRSEYQVNITKQINEITGSDKKTKK